MGVAKGAIKKGIKNKVSEAKVREGEKGQIRKKHWRKKREIVECEQNSQCPPSSYVCAFVFFVYMK